MEKLGIKTLLKLPTSILVICCQDTDVLCTNELLNAYQCPWTTNRAFHIFLLLIPPSFLADSNLQFKALAFSVRSWEHTVFRVHPAINPLIFFVLASSHFHAIASWRQIESVSKVSSNK